MKTEHGVKFTLCIPQLCASHKSNLPPVPQGDMEFRTLGHVGGGNRCGMNNL